MTYEISRPGTWRLGVALLLGGLLAPACDTTEEPTVDTADLRTEELDARCEYLVRCGFMPDRNTCMASELPDPGLVQALGGTSFDRVGYDAEAAAAYVDTLRNLSCDDTVENARTLLDAHAAIFGGRIEAGGACFADEECRGEAVCDRTACQGSGQICCTGQCVEIRYLSVGEACPLAQQGTRITSFCRDDAYCQAPPDDGSGNPPTQGTCHARVDNGLPCEQRDACLDGQRCNVGGSGNCYKLSASGEMCNPDLSQGSCLSLNEVCTGTCVAAPGPGQACVQGECIGYAACVDDVCVAYPRQGEACDGGLPCLGNLDCRDGVCQADLTSVVCVDGTPPPPPM
ncbi:MAG: hypothetical protein H6712_31465 [Myxococcales bacterium]|nr:hypothetical protein [Myxococcales bacterium]MCB9718410.1 hypothetical protein [Myxococcales bacterium]